MAIKIGKGFSLNDTTDPNFDRDQFATIADMAACTICDDGHVCYCKANKKRYEFHSENELDETTGYWREYVSGGGSSYTAGDGIRSASLANSIIAVNFGNDQDTILSDIGIGAQEDDTAPVGEDTSYEINCTSDQQYHLNISLVKRTLNGTDYKALKIIGNLFEHGAGVPWATYTGTVDGEAVSGTIQSYCEGESGSLTNIGYSNLGASDAVVSNIVITPVVSTKAYGFVVNNDGTRSFVSLKAYSA